MNSEFLILIGDTDNLVGHSQVLVLCFTRALQSGLRLPFPYGSSQSGLHLPRDTSQPLGHRMLSKALLLFVL